MELLQQPEWSDAILEAASQYRWTHLLVRKEYVHPQPIPLRRLWMELTMFVLCVATAAWCGARAVATGGELAYTINGIWAAYHGLMLAPLFFHFNKRVTVAPRPSLFVPFRQRVA